MFFKITEKMNAKTLLRKAQEYFNVKTLENKKGPAPYADP